MDNPQHSLDAVRFWRRPMFKWRCFGTIIIATYGLEIMLVFGPHGPREPQATIVLVGATIIWCICDGVDALIRGSNDT